jgi:hypothetical protein
MNSRVDVEGTGMLQIVSRWGDLVMSESAVLPRSRAAGSERQQGCTQSGTPTAGAELRGWWSC